MGVTAKPVFCVCGCGCKVPPEEIVNYRKTIDGRYINQKRCPEHTDSETSRVTGYVLKCETCGEVFEGRLANYCPECRAERKKESVRHYARIYYSKNPQAYAEYRDKHRAGQKIKFQPDGKKDHMDCEFFGSDKPCGKICIAEYFPCMVLEKQRSGRDAA